VASMVERSHLTACLRASLVIAALGVSACGGGGDGGGASEQQERPKPAAANPAAITIALEEEKVTCAEYRRMRSFAKRLSTVEDGLEQVDGGRSESTVPGVAVAERTTGHYAINVHEAGYPYDVIACGDIPRR
jgi:hypothetical protein